MITISDRASCLSSLVVSKSSGLRSRLRTLLILTFVATCFQERVGAQSESQREVQLAQTLQSLIKEHRGDVAVVVKDLASGETFSHRAHETMPTASLIKLPVMIEAYRQASLGTIRLDQMLTLKEDDKVPGSGILTNHFSSGACISLRDAIRLMIVYSDNTATNLVLDTIGLSATSTTMQSLGFPETQIHAKVFRRDTSIAPQRSEKYGLGSTTAADMVELLTRLYRHELVSRDASIAMLDHLLNCDDRSRFPALLPADTKVAHKTGSVNRVRTDAGLLIGKTGAVALCVLTDNNADTRWSDDNAANQLCANIAKAAYDHYLISSAPGNVELQMKVGATGDLVESLQRTLNARTRPSVDLSVDGDFGPATKAAVETFQKQANLAVTGVVDQATWQALGVLITADEQQPAPDVINQEKLTRQAADNPQGIPAVTCKAWSIADVSSGRSLWNEQGDTVLDIASTTKIMTAYIVMQQAIQSPTVLDEIVEYSERADKTGGSTAGVRVGEKISVGHLLYGLLLPSGNDAAVALAEHFGGRFAQSDQANSQSSYDSFVAEMNRQSQALGMTNSRFVNPHGLTAQSHKSTANDLAKLASAALRNPLFRKYVGTRQFGCTVTGQQGYQRNIVWRNTNQLLEIDGYLGVKTGTTDAAGACLVALAKREEKELLVVVLGSAVSQARYTDSRNLFAWAWRQLDKK